MALGGGIAAAAIIMNIELIIPIAEEYMWQKPYP